MWTAPVSQGRRSRDWSGRLRSYVRPPAFARAGLCGAVGMTAGPDGFRGSDPEHERDVGAIAGFRGVFRSSDRPIAISLRSLQAPELPRKPKRSLGAGLSGSQRKRNRRNSAIRARVAHIFRVVKRQFGYRKARYRGLAKNRAQVMTLIGLANLYLLRGRIQTA
ncbi:MAG: transposase [Stellaceae bacterium]